jgi:hypothetical protein
MGHNLFNCFILASPSTANGSNSRLDPQHVEVAGSSLGYGGGGLKMVASFIESGRNCWVVDGGVWGMLFLFEE